MTVQEEVRQRIERDVLLAKLRKKIDSGKADFNDTFLYSDRAGKLLGDIFAQRLPDIPIAEREVLCVELLRFQRPERRFDGPDALREQIRQDAAAARAYFEAE